MVIHFSEAALAANRTADVAVLFTQRITHAKLAAGTPESTVLADDFILARTPRPALGAKELIIDFEGDVIP